MRVCGFHDGASVGSQQGDTVRRAVELAMMPVEALWLESLKEVPPLSLEAPRVVVSRLGRGEVLIGGAAPSLKLVLEGEETYQIDGRAYRLQPGQMLLVDGGAAYEATIRQGRTRGLCVYLPQLSPGAEQETLPGGRALLRAGAAVQGGSDLRKLAGLVHAEDKLDKETAAAIVRAASAAMLVGRNDASEQIQRLALKRAGTAQEVANRLEAARAHLHATLDRIVPLAELAQVAGISPFQFSRYFSAAFGVAPARYHRSLRLHHALTLLRSGRVSATEAAERIGYCELAAFSAAFGREFGFPPSHV